MQTQHKIDRKMSFAVLTKGSKLYGQRPFRFSCLFQKNLCVYGTDRGTLCIGKKLADRDADLFGDYLGNKMLAVFALAAPHTASDALFHTGDGDRALFDSLYDLSVGYLLAAANDNIIIHYFTSNERCL